MNDKNKTKKELLHELEALRESESKYRALFESSHDIFLFLDKMGNIIDINLSGEQLTGYSQVDLRRMNIFQHLTVPGDHAIMREVIQDAFEGRSRTYEQRWKTKEGKIIYLDCLTVSRRSIAGEIVTTFCTLRDITARKLAEDALKGVSDIYILFDMQWRYLYVNEAAVRAIGRPQEQILERTLWELYPDIVGTELDRQYHRAMDERVPCTFDFYYPSTDTWWENRFYPVPEGLAAFGTNITERKRVEETLKGSEQKLRLYSKELEETNSALKVLLRQRENDKREIEERILTNVKQLVLPYVEMLRKSRRGDSEDAASLNIIESNLNEIVSSFATNLSQLGKLTPKEILVANLVKEGQADKDIANTLHLSIDTVKAHRRNIRKKLGISGEKTNLRSFLSALI